MTIKAAESASAWTYSPAPESAPVTIKPEHGLFVGGKWTTPKSATRRTTLNPANESPLSEVVESGAQEVEAAHAAARRALRPWSRLRSRERAKFLFRIARRIQERARELAIVETMDSGKPIRESRDFDVPAVAQSFFHHAGWCDKLRYAVPGVADPRPVGVCGQIIPWNFPLLMAAWKLAPALACGNTCVLKPAETTPLTALRLAEIFEEVDLPPGVVNVITGGPAAGKALVEHVGFDKIAFTGSTEVGKAILRACAGRRVKLTMELGGKSPNIVFADAPIDQAIEGIVEAIWFNQGQVCCAGSRLLVEESVLDEVITKLRARMNRLRVGDPLDKNTDVGPINSRVQLERIEGYLKIGVSEGAVLESCGQGAMPSRGFFCRPAFFTDVQPSATIAREEIFGPVLAIMSFRTPEEALLRANNTPYGLSAGVWTSKGSKIFDVARRLKAGVIWCNGFNLFDAASPFGGYKESGFGREGGRHGLREYLSH